MERHALDPRSLAYRLRRCLLGVAAGFLALGSVPAPAYADLDFVGGGTLVPETFNFGPAGLWFMLDYQGQLFYYFNPEPSIIKENALVSISQLHETEPFWPLWEVYIDGHATVNLGELRSMLENNGYWPWKQVWDSSCDDVNKADGWTESSHAYSRLEDYNGVLRYFVHGPASGWIDEAKWPECRVYATYNQPLAQHYSIEHEPGAPEPGPACEELAPLEVVQVRCFLDGTPHWQLVGHWNEQTKADGTSLETELIDGWTWFKQFANMADWSWGTDNVQWAAPVLGPIYTGYNEGDPYEHVLPAQLVEDGPVVCPPWECSTDPWFPPDPEPPVDGGGGGSGDGGDGGSDGGGSAGGGSGFEWPCIPLWQICDGFADAGSDIQDTELQNEEYDLSELMTSHDSRRTNEGGACPEPTTFQLLANHEWATVEIPWDLVCDGLYHAEPFIKLLGAIVSFGIALGGFSRF